MKLKNIVTFSVCLGMAWTFGHRMANENIDRSGTHSPYVGTCRPRRGNQPVPPTASQQERTYPMAPTPSGLLGPARQNAYGPGIWSDSAGRPFHWQTQDGQKVPFGNVKPDAYGPGIGMDEYGRPVKAVPGQ